MTWTHFWDMHSGGGLKEKWQHIFIEASEEEAKTIFYNRFGHNPERVTCTCCGDDYSIGEEEDLVQLTAFHRNCDWEGDEWVERSKPYGTYYTMDEYLDSDEAAFIYEKDIKPEERTGEVPEQGFVWQD